MHTDKTKAKRSNTFAAIATARRSDACVAPRQQAVNDNTSESNDDHAMPYIMMKTEKVRNKRKRKTPTRVNVNSLHGIVERQEAD